MTTITTSGRTNVKDFLISGLGGTQHTPFLVFTIQGDNIIVMIHDNVTDVLSYSDETKVMKQWQGNWRSDFFQFTVGQLREVLELENENLKQEILSATEITANINTRGNVKSISIRTDNSFNSDGFPSKQLWDLIVKYKSDILMIEQATRAQIPITLNYTEWKKRFDNIKN